MRTDSTLMLRQSLELVGPLLERGEAIAALKVLGDFRKDGVQPLSRVEWSEYCYAYARCLFRLGEHDRALPKVRVALRLSSLTSEHSLYASQTQLLGLIKLAQGEISDAIEAFNEAYAARKRARDFPNIFRPLQNLALAHVAKGDLQQAIDVFEDAVASAKRYNTQGEIRHCQFAQCVALLLAGRFDECSATLLSIRSHPLNALETAHLAKHSGQLAVCVLDTDQAREHLKQAMIFYARERLQRPYVVCLEFLGLNEFFAGNYAKAKEYYQQVLDMPEPTASAVAQTLRMLTDVYIAEGNWEEAKKTAVEAEAAITRINERIELAALWRAQAQIAEHDSDHEAARELFQKSIDLLQQCGARYELALTHFAAGQSTVHIPASRSEHLQKAKALFVEMDVSKRVAQVEKAIVGLISVKPQPKVFRNGRNSIETPDIITHNEQMLDILTLAKKFMDTDCNILITGETGTGKDLLAKWIHYSSNRAAGPYCNENMACFTDSLIESELFGCERGSHSRADRNKTGVIELADDGTFCLNEVAELPLDMQTRLLQVIEEGRVRRVGGGVPRPVDVRFIAITNGDLQERVNAGLFRQDLYYRLRGVELHLPPLRERKDDLPLLLQHLLSMRHFGDYTLEEAVAIVRASGCECYDWPGNVRELQDVIKQAVTRSPARRAADLIGTLKMIVGGLSTTSPEEAEREKLVAVLKRNGGNVSAAARTLGIPEATLRYRLKRQFR
jgi:transcriptional regulator with PAS, ATPase and Fis domain